MGTWSALKNEWTAIVVRHTDDGERGCTCQRQIERLVERWDGQMDDTGGGVMVGFVHFTVAVGSEDAGDARLEDATATITDEMIALWIGDEPFVEMPAEEVFAAEVVG